MLLAIQIFFSFKAFKSGWRFWVLLPWALMLAASITMGNAAAVADLLDIMALGFLLDLGLIGILVYMATHERGGFVPGPTDTAPARILG